MITDLLRVIIQADLASAMNVIEVTDSSEDLLARLDAIVLDSGRAICDAVKMIYRVVKLDRKQDQNWLLDQMVARIVPGLGWREYFGCVRATRRNGKQNRYVEFLRTIRLHEDDFDLVGQIILVILQSDLDTLRAILTYPVVRKFETIKYVFWKLLAEASCQEIRSFLANELRFDRSPELSRAPNKMRKKLRKSILRSDVKMVSLIIATIPNVADSSINVADQLFTLALSQYCQPEQKLTEKHEITSLVVSLLFSALSATSRSDEIKCLRNYKSRYTHPLLMINQDSIAWVIKYYPELIKDPKDLVFSAWRAKKATILLAAMDKLQVSRDQLIEWYNGDDETILVWAWCRSYHTGLHKASLDLEWIAGILSKKSARSGNE